MDSEGNTRTTLDIFFIFEAGSYYVVLIDLELRDQFGSASLRLSAGIKSTACLKDNLLAFERENTRADES